MHLNTGSYKKSFALLRKRFHRRLKEEEVWTAEYRRLEEARENIERYLWEYHHDPAAERPISCRGAVPRFSQGCSAGLLH